MTQHPPIKLLYRIKRGTIMCPINIKYTYYEQIFVDS